MRQFSTLYIPGCDHAGIATQAVVEKQLARNPIDGKSKRQDFSRSEFVRLCQYWKEDYHRAINKTIRRLSWSDWGHFAPGLITKEVLCKKCVYSKIKF